MPSPERPLPACCKDGHAFTRQFGVLRSWFMCMRCGKRVKA